MFLEQVTTPFRVYCKDSSNKPDFIKDEKWVKENEEYIVVKKFKHIPTGMEAYKILGLSEEIHEVFYADRFVKNMFSVN